MWVVTGGAGFIGSNLVAALAARGGAEVVVCDRLRRGDKWRNLAKHLVADIVAPERLFPFLDGHAKEIRGIFHLGAISATTADDGDLVIETNFRLSCELWSWCTRNEVPLVYASSAATYGSGENGFDDDPAPEALARLRPLNLYGWSKHLFDRRVMQQVAARRPQPPFWAGLKFFNVFGPNEYHKGAMQSVVAKIFPDAAAGRPATLFRSHRPDYADGGQLRDFVWVEDAVAVMLWLADRAQADGGQTGRQPRRGLYNVGSGKARSFADLAAAVFTALGREPRIDYVDMPEQLRAKYQYFTEARIDRLRQAGYDRPFTALEDAVGRYVRDFLATGDPWR